MATLAAFFKRSEAVAMTAGRREAIRAESDPFRLRALPNDDVYFYAKRIDNSRIIRQADPAARGECWSAVGAAAVLLMVGVSIIAPHVGSVLAGYKLESLRQERQVLLNERRELDVKEAGLLSPGRLHELARARSLTSPAADQVFHLDGQALDGSFARNRVPGEARGASVPALSTQ
jgi:hypothetical protein